MDDMIDLMAGDAMLRGRLEAYAEARLTPDLATSSRLRAKVLAVAHRQADLARADAALTVLPGTSPSTGRSLRERLTADTVPSRSAAAGAGVRIDGAGRRRRSAWRRTASVLLAASLGLGVITGTAFAARPGGPLYLTRVWVETLTLPSEPSARALAELERLDSRLREAASATASGDSLGAAAALGAYEAIIDEASASTILAGDSVASAALETGVARNVAVLQALAARLPDKAGVAIDRAIDRAIERAIDRSDNAIKAIDTAKPKPGGPNGGGNGGAPQTTSKPTKAPTPEPAATPKPTPKPTKEQVAEPTPKPTKPPKPDPTPKATSKAPGDPGKPGGADEPHPTPRRTPPPNQGGG